MKLNTFVNVERCMGELFYDLCIGQYDDPYTSYVVSDNIGTGRLTVRKNSSGTVLLPEWISIA